MVTGLVEGISWLIKQRIWGEIIRMSVHVIWMDPVANLIWVGLPGVLLALTALACPRWLRWRAAMGILVFFSSLSLVLLFTSMNRLVVLVVCLGLAVRASRLMTNRRDSLLRLVRRSLPVLAALVVACAAGIGGWRRWYEYRARHGLPAARAGAPNVLLIILDTVREQNLSAYGYERPTTPFLEHFAAEGTRFDLALAPAPWTLPSHGSIFTGRRPTSLGTVRNEPLDDRYPTISEALAAHGYSTGGFVANLAYCPRELGLSRGFHHYEDYPMSLGTLVYASRLGRVLMEFQRVQNLVGFHDILWRKNAAEVTGEFLRWQEHQQTHPFFAFLNYFDAHQPYIPPEPFRSRFTTITRPYVPRDVDVNFSDMTGDEIQWSEQQYDGSLAAMDHSLGQLMSTLKSRGVLDNTIVIITADHGEHFGDHRKVSHGNSLYRQLLEVPLIIRYPARVPAGRVVSEPVSLADLPRTVLDMAALSDPYGFPGYSLNRYIKHDSTFDPNAIVLSEMPALELPGATSLVQGNYHFIQWFEHPRQLFNLVEDPLETRDLAATPEGIRQIAKFNRALAEIQRDLPVKKPVRRPR
ncbi:MAG: sulfatase [Gemmatimonadota bacterium]